MSEIVCIILAGGRGSHMASARQHKTCFPIAGRPAIVRAIDTYKAAGLRRFLVVVGERAAQVIATVADAHPEVSYVYQGEPRGTGHAALVAAEALAAQDYHGHVVLTMGDKVTRPQVIRRLLQQLDAGAGDVVLTSLPKTPTSTAGRLVVDRKGAVLGIVEHSDIQAARRRGAAIRLGTRRFTAQRIERNCRSVNASLFAFRFEALHEALRQLRTDNVQGELYLTDTIGHLAGRVRIEELALDDAEDLMAFNTPAELLAIEQVVRRRERIRVAGPRRKRRSPRQLKPAGQWLKIIERQTPPWRSALRRLYGKDEQLLAERTAAIRKLVTAAARRFGADRPIVICRAPGRINLMGRHVDHRGGFVNVMAISRETLLAAAPRDDDVVTLHNLRPRTFPRREFRIADLLREASWAHWMDFVNSQAVQQVLHSAPGDWSHYARAPLLRLQHECPGVALRGMDCLVGGNVPMGSGLSSSSTLVVAFAEAAVVLNELDVAIHDFVDLCGEGEWFVGSRGGSADHAAIRVSQAGQVSRIAFFPFQLHGQVRFPADLQVVIADSCTAAVKTTTARDTFNQRVACYNAAELLLRRRWPTAAGMEHLRDLSPQRLKARSADVYRGLMTLPPSATRRQLCEMAPKADREQFDRIFASHRTRGRYDLRGVALFGIAECLRSEQFADVLKRGDLDAIGQFMRISHNGDRVANFDDDRRARSFRVRTDDATLERLADQNAPLIDQPGRYACSIEAVDQMVDIAQATEGVVGAQLSGAGLGGCMMILVRRAYLDHLLDRLGKQFYRRRRLPVRLHPCTPIAGAGLLAV